jgi:MFS family permease
MKTDSRKIADLTPLPGARLFRVITLAPGISAGQGMALVCVAMISMAMQAFIPLMMPYILDDRLHIDMARQGTIVGTLSLVQNLVFALTILIFGALADRFGRRLFLLIALGSFAVSCIWFPFVYSIVPIVVISAIFGAGQAAHQAGNGTSVLDYPDNRSRGKFLCLMMLTQGLSGAIFVGKVAMHLPEWLEGHYFQPLQAIKISYATIAVLGAIGMVLAMAFLRTDLRSRPENGTSLKAETRRLTRQIRAVAAQAVRVPRYRFVFLAGIVLRADFAMMATFLSLWTVSAGHRRGIDTPTALATAGNLFAVFSVTASISPILFGYWVDRFDRAKLLLITLGLAGAAFLGPVVVGDVFGLGGVVAVAVIGFAEGAIIITANALLGQETPAELRGTAYGVFSLLGLLGLVVINFVGGLLFDRVSNVAPFVIIGILNLLILLIARKEWRPDDTGGIRVLEIHHAK